MRILRRPDNPIITPASHPSLTEFDHSNINGPSLIRVPDWLPNPLGRYYLYFAHHQGTFIRLAYADDLAGPWQVHVPGTLQLAQTPFPSHIASPDVHVDHDHRRIVMYYHGCCRQDASIAWEQYTCAATSSDGVHFESRTEPLCGSYLRMFRWRGRHYGIAMPGEWFTSADGLTQFQRCPHDIADALCWPDRMTGNDRKARHFAVHVRGDELRLFFTRAGDCPEHLMAAVVPLNDDWTTWRPSQPGSVLLPEMTWEGADQPLTPSRGGAVHQRVRQLRDPAVFVDDDHRAYLAYAIAGEAGIALAEIAD